jgi:hypothetical protein
MLAVRRYSDTPSRPLHELWAAASPHGGSYPAARMDWTAVIPWTTSARRRCCRGVDLRGVVVVWLMVRGGWLVAEVDMDGLLGSAFLLLGEVSQCPPVRPGEGRLQDAAWPQAARADDVDLGGQVQP